MADRIKANRALAKVLAYQECGKLHEARAWARTLLRELGYTAKEIG